MSELIFWTLRLRHTSPPLRRVKTDRVYRIDQRLIRLPTALRFGELEYSPLDTLFHEDVEQNILRSSLAFFIRRLLIRPAARSPSWSWVA